MQEALGKNYFINDDFPVRILKVIRKEGRTHEHDLTEVFHYHDFIEIVIILKGTGNKVVEGNEYKVSAGDIFVLQGYQVHAFKDCDNLEIVNVMFKDKKKDKLLNFDKLKELDGYNPLFYIEPNFRNRQRYNNILRLDRKALTKVEYIVNSMIHEQAKQKQGFELIIRNKLEELIVILSRAYSKLDTKESKLLIRISKVLDYIEANFEEEINLPTLAEKCYMSVRNFQRIFKKATGQSPIDYLIHIRLQKAKSLLRNTDLPLVDVAFKAGFSEYNYFSRKFKQIIGVPPTKYKLRFK